jgi:hypothetical protein
MSSMSTIPDVKGIILGPIERDHETDFGFRRTIEIRSKHGTDYTIVLTSADRSDLEITTPNH